MSLKLDHFQLIVMERFTKYSCKLASDKEQQEKRMANIDFSKLTEKFAFAEKSECTALLRKSNANLGF